MNPYANHDVALTLGILIPTGLAYLFHCQRRHVARKAARRRAR